MTNDIEKNNKIPNILDLIDKSCHVGVKLHDGGVEAMRLSQAALNSANAMMLTDQLGMQSSAKEDSLTHRTPLDVSFELVDHVSDGVQNRAATCPEGETLWKCRIYRNKKLISWAAATTPAQAMVLAGETIMKNTIVQS